MSKKIITFAPDTSSGEKLVEQLAEMAAECVSSLKPPVIFNLAVHTVMRGLLEEMGVLEKGETMELLAELGIRVTPIDKLPEVLEQMDARKAAQAEKDAEKQNEETADEDGEEVPADSCQPMFSAEGETTNPQH